jgi:hypothetical protein
MKERRQKSGKLKYGSIEANNLLFQKVKWTEDGILHLGTVAEIYSVKGTNYLTVMTMFGKRCRVKMSKVKLVSEHLRA